MCSSSLLLTIVRIVRSGVGSCRVLQCCCAAGSCDLGLAAADVHVVRLLALWGCGYGAGPATEVLPVGLAAADVHVRAPGPWGGCWFRRGAGASGNRRHRSHVWERLHSLHPRTCANLWVNGPLADDEWSTSARCANAEDL